MTVAAMGGHFGKPGNACGDDQYYSAFNRGPALAKGTSCVRTYKNPVDDSLKHNEMWNAILTGKYVFTGDLNTEAWARPRSATSTST